MPMRSRARAGENPEIRVVPRKRESPAVFQLFRPPDRRDPIGVGPCLRLMARDCRMDIEQRAVGVEDENGRHGILRNGRLWLQRIAARAKAPVAVAGSEEWRQDKAGRRRGPSTKAIGTRATCRSWACATTRPGCALRYSMAPAHSRAFRRISICTASG